MTFIKNKADFFKEEFEIGKIPLKPTMKSSAKYNRWERSKEDNNFNNEENSKDKA